MKIKKTGSALIATLTTLLIVNSIVMLIISTENTMISELQTARQYAQVRLFQLSIVEWIRFILYNDQKQGGPDSLHRIWATPLNNIPIADGYLSGYIEDMHSRFNLANLIQNQQINLEEFKNFQRLLEELSLPLDLAKTIEIWLKKKINSTKSSPIFYAEQFLNFPQFTTPILYKLYPFIILLPEPTKININTASIEVIIAALDIPREVAKNIIFYREKKTIDEVIFEELLKDFSPREKLKKITFRSQYFLLHGSTTLQKVKSNLSVLIYRRTNNSQLPKVIWQKLE